MVVPKLIILAHFVVALNHQHLYEAILVLVVDKVQQDETNYLTK
jgi:hypothetical protein